MATQELLATIATTAAPVSNMPNNVAWVQYCNCMTTAAFMLSWSTTPSFQGAGVYLGTTGPVTIQGPISGTLQAISTAASAKLMVVYGPV